MSEVYCKATNCKFNTSSEVGGIGEGAGHGCEVGNGLRGRSVAGGQAGTGMLDGTRRTTRHGDVVGTRDTSRRCACRERGCAGQCGTGSVWPNGKLAGKHSQPLHAAVDDSGGHVERQSPGAP